MESRLNIIQGKRSRFNQSEHFIIVYYNIYSPNENVA